MGNFRDKSQYITDIQVTMKYSWYDVVPQHDTILEAGQMYKELVRNKLKQHIKMKNGPVAFSILCQIKLVKCKRIIFNTEKLLTSDGIKKPIIRRWYIWMKN